MSKMLNSWKKQSFIKILGLFLLVLMISATLTPRIVSAETEKKVKYFVIQKEWKNDLIAERPSSVTIHIDGSDGYSKDETLTANENWKKAFSLPAYDNNGTEIIYTVYEKEAGLDKYEISNPSGDGIIISKSNGNCIFVDDNSDKKTTVFNVNNSGPENSPVGNVLIEKDLILNDDVIVGELPAGFSGGSFITYTNPVDKTQTDSRYRIKYSGNLIAGVNDISGKIVLKWDNAATSFITGEKYDVQLTISEIKIFSPEANDNANVAVLAAYDAPHMQSYITDNFSETNAMLNIVGVKANVEFNILKKDETPATGYIQVYIADIDTPDTVSNYCSHREDYYEHGKGMGYNFLTDIINFYGLDMPYAESVQIKSPIASDVFLSPETQTQLIHNSNNDKYAAKTGAPNLNNDPVASLSFLAPANSYSFTWTGSDCGTAIYSRGSFSVDEDAITSKITNTSSLYMARYFFQQDDGTYKTSPDKTDNLVMIKPGSKVSVQNNAKTVATDVDPTKTDYALDLSEGRTDLTTEYEVNTSHTAANPRVLDVYFKKVYRVIYHDNVDDKIWNPADQTNPELDYGTDTPGYDTDISTEIIEEGDPERAGYTFDGWSETAEGDIINVPLTVTKNADYWAHWTPRTDTKYKVEYYYEVNGSYPTTPDYTSADRKGTTDTEVEVTNEDRISVKSGYTLNSNMTSKWKGIVAGDGSLILKVYFKQLPPRESGGYTIPVTGIE